MRIVYIFSILFLSSCIEKQEVKHTSFNAGSIFYSIDTTRNDYHLLFVKTEKSSDSAFIKIDAKTGDILMVGRRNKIGFHGQISYFDSQKLYQLREWVQVKDEDFVNNEINFKVNNYEIDTTSDYICMQYDSINKKLHYLDKYRDFSESNNFYGYNIIFYDNSGDDFKNDTIYLGKQNKGVIDLSNYNIKEIENIHFNRIIIDSVLNKDFIETSVRTYFLVGQNPGRESNPK